MNLACRVINVLGSIYGGFSSVYISTEGVELGSEIPFMNSVFIPTEEIAGCAMTCFGTNDQYVDLLIPKTGTDVMIQSSDVLLRWCWNNKKPMFSGKSKRGWLYENQELPSSKEFESQFSDWAVFEYQKKQSCLGY